MIYAYHMHAIKIRAFGAWGAVRQPSIPSCSMQGTDIQVARQEGPNSRRKEMSSKRILRQPTKEGMDYFVVCCRWGDSVIVIEVVSAKEKEHKSSS